MKPIQLKAAPVIAAVALAGLFSWGGQVIGGGSAVARAESRGGVVHTIDRVGTDLAGVVATQPLTTGCNQITEVNFPVGGKVGDWVSQNVQPASAAISVWHFDNASQRYKAAYFQEPAVPVDQPTFNSAIDGFFICVSGSSTAP